MMTRDELTLMHGSTESESILQTTKVFAHSIFFDLHESILGLNSTGRLGEASVKHYFSILTRPSSALAYRTYPVPRIRKLHVFTQLLSPLLYYMYMLLWICKSTWDSPPETILSRRLLLPGVYFGFVTILVNMILIWREKNLSQSPPPLPGHSMIVLLIDTQIGSR